MAKYVLNQNNDYFYVEFYSKKHPPIAVKFNTQKPWSTAKIRKELNSLGYKNVSIYYVSGII